MNQKEKLIEASRVGDLVLVKSLLKEDFSIHANEEALRNSAYNGHLEVVKYLIENGVDIHARNDYALRLASYNGHIEMVKYLVEKGADIHASNDEALRWSTLQVHLEIVKYLIKKGANIHARNDEILKTAIKNGDLKTIKYFLFDCQMKIKQKTKDWLIENNQKVVLDLIEKRDLLLKLDKDIIPKDSINNLGKKVKI